MNTLILVGINRYGPAMGGASLLGCVHDDNTEFRWAHDHRNEVPGNLNVIVLTNEQATAAAIRGAIAQGVKAAGPGEYACFKQSSHGAAPGLVCYDSDWNRTKETFLGADVLGDLFAKANPQAKMFMDIDCCEFGDSMADVRELLNPYRYTVNRYLPNPTGFDMRTISAPNAIVPRGISNLATVAGCVRGGTCADVRDAMGAYGAYTHYVVQHRGELKISEFVALTNQDFAKNQFEQRCVTTGPDWVWMR